MSTVTSDQGRAHAASVSPELGSRAVGQTIAKPLSSDALVHIGGRAPTENVFQEDRHARNASLDAALDRHVTSRTCHQHALRHPAAPSLVHERTGRTAYLETRSTAVKLVAKGADAQGVLQ